MVNAAIPGWTALLQDGTQAAYDIALRASIAQSPGQGGLAVNLVSDAGALAIVSAAHTVLPGETLTLDVGGDYTGLFITSTMAYSTNPPNEQVRVDAYSACDPAFPSAASLNPAIFDPSSITAGPFLGNLLSALEVYSSDRGWRTLTADLSPYAGKTIYIAFRLTGLGVGYQRGLDNFNVVC